jgi:hypothetical protein
MATSIGAETLIWYLATTAEPPYDPAVIVVGVVEIVYELASITVILNSALKVDANVPVAPLKVT